MWNPTEELKNLTNKAKSFKSKLKDIDAYVQAFEKHFEMVKFPNNPQKTIEYFFEIFLSCLHLNPIDKLFDCFKRMVNWLCQDRTKKSAYYLVKQAVEICEREFPADKLKEKQKNVEQSVKKKSEIRESRQRQMNNERERKQTNYETLKNNLKIILNLVKKAGDKNLLDDEVYAAFVEYYLQRIESQIQAQVMTDDSSEGNKSNPMNNLINFDLGSFILSELSSVLINRNKQLIVPTVQRHIKNASGNNLSSNIGFYLIKEIRHFPEFLTPVLTGLKGGQKITYKSLISSSFEKRIEVSCLDSPDRCIILVNEFIESFSVSLKKQNWDLVQNFYHLYFSSDLSNSEQLLNRIYVCVGIHGANQKNNQRVQNWEEWRKKFMVSHKQYVEATQISPSANSNFLNIRYVIKLFILSAWLIYPKRDDHSEKLISQINSGTQEILSTLNHFLKKNHKNKQSSLMVEENEEDPIKVFINELKGLVGDCCKFLKINVSTPNNSNLLKYVEKQKKWTSFVLDLSEKYSLNNHQLFETKIKQEFTAKQAKDCLFEEWKIAMQVMFSLSSEEIEKSKNISEKDIQNKQEQIYNRQVIQALNALSLRPSHLAEIRSPKKEVSLLVSSLSIANSLILDTIIGIQNKQNVVAEIKKLMAQSFDKVGPQVIRDKICHSSFLSRCLLMTNHSNKCKILIDEILRYYECAETEDQKSAIKSYIQQLFPKIHSFILIDFCRYISSKDKLQFRMVLYDKEMTNLDFILNQDLFESTEK